MLVAIGCGLAASYMTSRVIAERGAPAEIEKVSILVAKRNLSMGTLITEPEKLFDEKQVTKGEEPKKAIRSFEELKKSRLNKPLSAEQFVTSDDLIDSDKGLNLDKGMRAVALNVNAEKIAGGFVLPHTHVDIVSVISGNNGETTSKIILQKILVLAVDQSANRPDDKQAVVASTVTVQVTPEQAQRLALAQKLGTISLILRAFDDDQSVTTKAATSTNILQESSDGKSDDTLVMDGDSGGKRPPSWGPKVPDVPTPAVPASAAEQKPAEPPPPPPPPKVHTMMIYNGQTPTKAIFTLNDKDEETNTRIEKGQPDGVAAPKTAVRPAVRR
jgi:pilus assembly protein CpaB